MLVEIFLLRLELAMRMADETSRPVASRFVPLPRGVKPKFKTRLVVV
ncbi:MAG TPA: hypothetical protein VHU22_03470 [Xanthobacteraceae bacterium]|jgi:hypothetical protein|nr:hypothetical protein [Xanthobacteraceae bacterium]